MDINRKQNGTYLQHCILTVWAVGDVGVGWGQELLW